MRGTPVRTVHNGAETWTTTWIRNGGEIEQSANADAPRNNSMATESAQINKWLDDLARTPMRAIGSPAEPDGEPTQSTGPRTTDVLGPPESAPPSSGNAHTLLGTLRPDNTNAPHT